jgi:hypothetical protein
MLRRKKVRSRNRTCFLFRREGLVFIASVCIFTVCFANQQSEKKPDEKSDGNGKCYVCHPGLKQEDITTAHLEMDITCDNCHGPSIEHMHDEMLMTKPDLLFGRSEVDKMCSNPTCHRSSGERGIYGRVDHKEQQKIEAFFKQWQGRTRQNGRAVTVDSVCTDCHGKHNLDKAVVKQSEQGESAEWLAAFNGSDLTGWQPSGSASWVVKSSRIVGTPGANGKSGTLWSQQLYDNYLLAVTFRTEGPIRAAISLRGTDSQPGPQVEIFESSATDNSSAFTGSVWVPRKGLVLVNWRKELIDYESWNTISVKLENDRVQVWLNGEEIGSVRIVAPAKGKIGLHIENHPDKKTAELSVREILIHRLTEPNEPASETAFTGQK